MKIKHKKQQSKQQISFKIEPFNVFQSRITALHSRNKSFTLPQKIKSFINQDKELSYLPKPSNNLKLPKIFKVLNPQSPPKLIAQDTSYYQSKIKRSLNTIKQTNYLILLARQHFIQTIDALRIKPNQIDTIKKEIRLHKKEPCLKTVYLDLDETLIHCEEQNRGGVQLRFPLQNGSYVMAGVKIRPYCEQFLKQLSSFAEIIIFTASSASYTDVVLDYLDPNNKYFSHRLYRHHCIAQKGFYIKDLTAINRRMEDSVLVDNSAHSYLLQPFNGIPILPFYHYPRDKELLSLLSFLRIVLQQNDVRDFIKKHFFWHKYLNQGDPKQIFSQNYGNK